MRNKVTKCLIYLIEGECNKLEMLYPGHDLLKYALPNKIKISRDFVKNFLPNPELFFKRRYNSEEKYEEAVDLSYKIALKNYLIALREAVGKAKKKDKIKLILS